MVQYPPPPGYHLKSKFIPRWIQVIFVVTITSVIFYYLWQLLLELNYFIRPDFEANQMLIILSDIFGEWFRVILGIAGFLLLFGYGVLHEVIHGKIYKQYTGVPVDYHWNFGIPAVTLRPGVYVRKKHAIIASLGPFLFFTSIGIIGWVSLPTILVPVCIFIIACNVGASMIDLIQAVWLIIFGELDKFGYDGRDSVKYTPN